MVAPGVTLAMNRWVSGGGAGVAVAAASSRAVGALVFMVHGRRYIYTVTAKLTARFEGPRGVVPIRFEAIVLSPRLYIWQSAFLLHTGLDPSHGISG